MANLLATMLVLGIANLFCKEFKIPWYWSVLVALSTIFDPLLYLFGFMSLLYLAYLSNRDKIEKIIDQEYEKIVANRKKQ